MRTSTTLLFVATLAAQVAPLSAQDAQFAAEIERLMAHAGVRAALDHIDETDAQTMADLVRLTELAHRLGEVGEMEHTACYFKSPLAGGSHDFHDQYQRLLEYALAHAS